MIQEGKEGYSLSYEYEYIDMVLATARVGRAKVLAPASQVMQSATEYTVDPAAVMDARKACAGLIAASDAGGDVLGVCAGH